MEIMDQKQEKMTENRTVKIARTAIGGKGG